MQNDFSERNNANRRDFLVGNATLAVAGVAAMSAISSTSLAHEPSGSSLIKPRSIILFQGDSITDVGRNRKDNNPNSQDAMGFGYAWMAASQMLVSRPEMNLTFFNRGISGNKVYQLAERWQADCIDLKPDVVSILIGVNDIWHKLNGNYDGTVEVYENDYLTLLKRTKDALPEVQIVVCEPFVLKCGVIDDKWFPAFDGYRAAAKRVAESTGATFVSFQEMFDRAIKYATPQHWAEDGVHPTDTGAALMAHAWLDAVGMC